MSYTFGYNFRLTPSLTVDAADETYVQMRSQGDSQVTDIYPTLRVGSQPFGYDAYDVVTTEGYDEPNAATLDRRLAGHHQQGNGAGQARFVASLPAPGVYDVHLAAGSAIFAQAAMNFDIFDDQAIIYSLYLPSGIAGDTWMDALQNFYSATDWPVNEKPVRLTFRSTFCRVRYGLTPDQQPVGVNLNTTVIAHVRLTQVIPFSAPAYTGTGGITFAGAAATQSVPQAATTKTYVPTGGLHFGGSAATNAFLTALKQYVGSGVLRFAGSGQAIATQPPARLPRATTVPWEGQMTTRGITL